MIEGGLLACSHSGIWGDSSSREEGRWKHTGTMLGIAAGEVKNGGENIHYLVSTRFEGLLMAT